MINKLFSKIIIVIISILLVSILVMAGCGSQKTTISKEVQGTLQVYTSQPNGDVKKIVDAYQKHYPKVKVNVFRSGTEEVIARINTEVKAGKLGADIMLLADAPTFEILKEKKLLLAYRSSETKGINIDLLDSDNMYSPTKMIPTGIVVNTNKVKNIAEIDWNILIAPENKGKVVMPSPLYSGAAAYNMGIFKAQSGMGWKYYEGLKANNIIVVKGNGAVIKSVASGETSYGMVVDFMAHNAQQKGSPVAFIYPKTGIPVITEPVAIAKSTQNPVAAKAFVDFVLSEEGQKIAVSQGYLPVKGSVASPKGRPAADNLKILSAKIKKLVDERTNDKKEFSKLFGG